MPQALHEREANRNGYRIATAEREADERWCEWSGAGRVGHAEAALEAATDDLLMSCWLWRGGGGQARAYLCVCRNAQFFFTPKLNKIWPKRKVYLEPENSSSGP